jgi:hypothetical protein
MSIVLVGGLLVAALNTVGASARGSLSLADHTRAHLAAQQLMAEILVKDYEDPDEPPVFGREATENSPNRSGFDDVDDYREWTSSAPVTPGGSAIAGLYDWTRSSTVDWVEPADLTTVSSTDTGVKRITVTLTKANEPTRILAKLVAIRTAGPPPPDPKPKILFVVTDDQNLSSQESGRVALIESWGYTAKLINASENQAQFSVALADVVAAYVPATANEVLLGTKLRDAPVGVVNGDAELVDEFGFSSTVAYTDSVDVKIVDSTHYITSVFVTDWITVYTSTQSVFLLNGSIAPGLVSLGGARMSGPQAFISFSALDTGAALDGSGTAAARRVQLPWGAGSFDINALNADGQTILKRAIEWAAGLEQ